MSTTAADSEAIGYERGYDQGCHDGRAQAGEEIAKASAPTWSPVAESTGDLLDLLANEHPEIPSKAEEWETFLAILRAVAAENAGFIDQNETRPRLHGVVTANRVGPMFRRACREGRIRPEGYTTTRNSTSGNGGKPAVAYRWLVA